VKTNNKAESPVRSTTLPPALEVHGLTKHYGDLAVLDSLSLKLPNGSLVGLLGPNGSGKTTLMKLVAGLITPNSGTIRIAGFDLYKQERQARGMLAYVPDVPNLYPELTVYEHLELIARAHGALDTFGEAAQMMLDRFGLWFARDSPTFALSRGMTQKVAICGAFIRPSRLLLMDEPGGSLDIASVDELYAVLEEYREVGGTALLSSHQWETLQDVCDYFVLLSPQGVVAGEMPDLRAVAELPEDATLRDVYLEIMTGRRSPRDGERGRGRSAPSRPGGRR
jgi:ABC-2 type transport system ATP-binding protein